MPKTPNLTLDWTGNGHGATTQRYEALLYASSSQCVQVDLQRAYCSKLLVLHRARCGFPDPYQGKQPVANRAADTMGRNRGEWARVSGQR